MYEAATCRRDRVYARSRRIWSRAPDGSDARKAEGKPENQQGYVPETGSRRDGVRPGLDKQVVRRGRQVDKSCKSEVRTRIWRCRNAVMRSRCSGRI